MTVLFRRLARSALAAFVGAAALAAQEETAAERQYREDYERVTKAVAVTEPLRRADQLFAFLKERPDSKVADYAHKNYLIVLEGLAKAENLKTLLPLTERMVSLRPKVPETYYFHSVALRGAGRDSEAMEALARCSVVRNPFSRQARERLEFLYRASHKGTLGGLDEMIKKAQAAMSP